MFVVHVGANKAGQLINGQTNRSNCQEKESAHSLS